MGRKRKVVAETVSGNPEADSSGKTYSIISILEGRTSFHTFHSLKNAEKYKAYVLENNGTIESCVEQSPKASKLEQQFLAETEDD